MWQWNDETCELYHYGVKGMKWGVRKQRMAEKKLNRVTSKADKSENRYKSYETAYKMADAKAQKTMTPAQYGRWVTSGARFDQKIQLRNLKKASERTKKRANDYMNKLNENYTVVYDVTTGTYTLRQK